MIFVSSCLVGINCKYSGGNNFNEKIAELLINNGIEVINCDEIRKIIVQRR